MVVVVDAGSSRLGGDVSSTGERYLGLEAKARPGSGDVNGGTVLFVEVCGEIR